MAIYADTVLAEHGKQYQNLETSVPPQTKILLYTDGLTEVRVAGGNTYFEDDCLADVLYANRGLAADEFVRVLYRSVNEYRCGAPYEDDICIICLEC
jgi:serine phosphatase RsbU (regulator of sigma subunit)